MKLKDKDARFGLISILNHWTVAVLIIALLGLGLYMGELPKGPERLELVQIHKSLGIIALFLGIWRVSWRFISKFPDEIAEMPSWQSLASITVHYLLLAAIIIMPVSGYISSSMGGHAVSIFGIFDMPALPENKDFSGISGNVHEISAYILITVLLLHILAALKHHIIDKDATLRRMIGR